MHRLVKGCCCLSKQGVQPLFTFLFLALHFIMSMIFFVSCLFSTLDSSSRHHCVLHSGCPLLPVSISVSVSCQRMVKFPLRGTVIISAPAALGVDSSWCWRRSQRSQGEGRVMVWTKNWTLSALRLTPLVGSQLICASGL